MGTCNWAGKPQQIMFPGSSLRLAAAGCGLAPDITLNSHRKQFASERKSHSNIITSLFCCHDELLLLLSLLDTIAGVRSSHYHALA